MVKMFRNLLTLLTTSKINKKDEYDGLSVVGVGACKAAPYRLHENADHSHGW